FEEEIDRPARSLSDQLQGLHGRLGLAGFDKVDRRAADVGQRHLAQAEACLQASLFNRAGANLDAAAPPPTAARGGLPLPSRAVRLRLLQWRGWHERQLNVRAFDLTNSLQN